MDMVPVSSSSDLASVGYDPESETLQVAFHSGSVYQYFHVPAFHHEGLMNAPSKGGYLNEHIKKGGYAYMRVG